MRLPISRTRGFTLTEAMIVVALLALTATLALPSYTSYVIRGNRAEAIDALLTAAACQERLYVRNNVYDANACEISSPNGYYSISVSTSNANQSFTASATPQEGQDKDPCKTLTVDETGARTADGQGGTFAQNCWSGKQVQGSV